MEVSIHNNSHHKQGVCRHQDCASVIKSGWYCSAHKLRDFICQWCGAHYKSTTNNSKFCSRKCGKRLRFNKGALSCSVYFPTCKTCNSIFTSKKNDHSVSCSRKCRVKRRLIVRRYKRGEEAKKQLGSAIKFCSICNKSILYTKSSSSRYKYCSYECKREAHKNSDNYILRKLRATSLIGEVKEIPTELIELKRQTLTIKRIINEKQ